MIVEKDLPDGWKKYTLKNVGTIVTGNTPPKKEAENYGGDLPWIKPPDLDKKMFISSSNENISDIGRNKVRLLPKGSVLISCIGNIGKIAIANCELCTNQQINSIIPNTDIVDSIFLYYLMKKIKPNLENMASSAVVPLLNKSDFSNVVVSLPPLQTQKKIVAILEKAERLKEWRKEADELTDEFLKSTFLEMFGDPIKNHKHWEIITLEKFASEIVDCPHSTPKHVEHKTNYPCIRTTELKNGYIDWKKMKYLDEDEYEKRVKRLIPIEGDIIYGREGSFGEAVRIPSDIKMSLGQRVMLFRPKLTICNSEFLWALLRSDSIYSQAVKKTSGSTVGHVNIKDIKKFKCIYPPLELQQKFATIVQQVEQLREHQSQSRQHIDDLFNVLMQKAFKGELI